MELWNAEIEKKALFCPLYSKESQGKDAEVLVKYFNPYGAGTWLITEAEQQEDGDWLLFGYCHILEWEWGYVLLSEIENTMVDLWGCKFPLERDLYIKEGATVRDLVGEDE